MMLEKEKNMKKVVLKFTCIVLSNIRISIHNYIYSTVILKAILLAGVTGSGKTEFALKLSKKYETTLISCDSVQIYNKLHILSNKPTDIGTHSMIDFFDYKCKYDVYKYVEDVNKELELCIAKNKIPIIVGGTGFYFSKLNLEKFDILKLFLTQKREILFDRLDARCEDMIINGLLEEVKEAKKDGISEEHILGRSIGCRDGLIFLKELDSSPENYIQHFEFFMKNFKRRTRNYARRQECWFRSTDFIWLDIDIYNPYEIIEKFLNDSSIDLKKIDAQSRCVNENAFERMKTFISTKSKLSDKIIEEIVNKLY